MVVRGLRTFRSSVYLTYQGELSPSLECHKVEPVFFLYKYMYMLNCGYCVYSVKEWTTTRVAAE